MPWIFKLVCFSLSIQYLYLDCPCASSENTAEKGVDTSASDTEEKEETKVILDMPTVSM